MRQTSGATFFRSFSDTLARAFRWQRTESSTSPIRAAIPERHPRIMPVLSAPRLWLSELSWQKVLSFNQSQCQLQNTQPTPNQKSYESVRQLWDSSLTQPMSLVKALDLCKDCHDKSPFVFSNSSTFCLVANAMVEDLAKDLPPVEAHIVRATAANYVSGGFCFKKPITCASCADTPQTTTIVFSERARVSKRELIEILRVYESKWSLLAHASGNGHMDKPANG